MLDKYGIMFLVSLSKSDGTGVGLRVRWYCNYFIAPVNVIARHFHHFETHNSIFACSFSQKALVKDVSCYLALSTHTRVSTATSNTPTRAIALTNTSHVSLTHVNTSNARPARVVQCTTHAFSCHVCNHNHTHSLPKASVSSRVFGFVDSTRYAASNRQKGPLAHLNQHVYT